MSRGHEELPAGVQGGSGRSVRIAARGHDQVGRRRSGVNPETLRPNTKYIGDITHLPILGRKFCYTATVIDLAQGRPAGWAIADHRRADLVSDAMAAAIRPRGSLAGSIMHTGHGARYTSSDFAEAFSSAGARRHMSAVGAQRGQRSPIAFRDAFHPLPTTPGGAAEI
ncbi:DDE-type integrase/transposase/recombinase [Streptomyces microflavus]|uniref:DDE-type integrase/transposase/recombinase n=1 Tax=Streptomyces microflavus TaxID=1919 RepID=UPI0033F4FCAC